jgi:hypothetical protein
VRQIRDGERLTHETAASPDPLWMSQLEWPVIIHELGLGHPMKFIWEERAKALITYPNFWKQFYRKFPQYREATITAREFAPAERVEVDYAGDPIDWYEIKTGEIHKAVISFGNVFSPRYFECMRRMAAGMATPLGGDGQSGACIVPTRRVTRRPLQDRAAAHHSDRYFLLFSGITPERVARLRYRPCPQGFSACTKSSSRPTPNPFTERTSTCPQAARREPSVR